MYNLSMSLMGPGNGRRLRIYGSMDLPPSLPLPPTAPATYIPESNTAGNICASRSLSLKGLALL